MELESDMVTSSIAQRRNPGQALLEFALVIPLFIFAFIIFLDLAFMSSNYIALSNAVREGTRYAIVHEFDEVNISDVVFQHTPSLDHVEMTVTASRDETRVTVSGTYNYHPITPGLKLFLGEADTVTLRVQSTATISPLYQ